LRRLHGFHLGRFGGAGTTTTLTLISSHLVLPLLTIRWEQHFESTPVVGCRYPGCAIANGIKLGNELLAAHDTVAGNFNHIVCRAMSQDARMAAAAVEVCQKLPADVPAANVDARHGVEDAVQAGLSPPKPLDAPTGERTRALVWKWHGQSPARLACSHHGKLLRSVPRTPGRLAPFGIRSSIIATGAPTSS
jgi:hypothetical protein